MLWQILGKKILRNVVNVINIVSYKKFKQHGISYEITFNLRPRRPLLSLELHLHAELLCFFLYTSHLKFKEFSCILSSFSSKC